jgi:hypothetical protein
MALWSVNTTGNLIFHIENLRRGEKTNFSFVITGKTGTDEACWVYMNIRRGFLPFFTYVPYFILCRDIVYSLQIVSSRRSLL